MRNIRFKWTQSSKETFDSLGHTCFARWALAPYTSSSLPLPCSLYLPLTMAIIITNWLCLLCQALFGFLENLLILHWIKIKICLHGLRQLSRPLGSTLLPAAAAVARDCFRISNSSNSNNEQQQQHRNFQCFATVYYFCSSAEPAVDTFTPIYLTLSPHTALKHPPLDCCCLELTENPFVATICCAKIKTFNLLLIN